MNLRERSTENICVIEIEGEVDLYNAKQIKDALDEKIKAQVYEVIVNLAQVPFMDSSGIGTLVTAMYKFKKYHGNLKVCNIHGSVAKVFKMTGMESHLQVYDTEEEAVKAFVSERSS